jgi:hypothetical protein
MTDTLPDVWARRDFPVLVEVVRRLDQGDSFVMTDAVAAALRRRGLITVSGTMAVEFDTFDVSGEAYLLTGLHPDGDDAVSRLVDALRQAAERTSDAAEKSKLRQVADLIGGLSREVAAGAMTAVLTGGLGS